MSSSPSSLIEKKQISSVTKVDSHSSVDAFYIDPVAEQRLLRKLDWTLIPLCTLIYLINFIDRTAVGNAKIAGLATDLNLVGFQYNAALTVFYVAYIAVEIPSNLILKSVGSIWLAILVLSFGIVSIGTAFVHSFAGLVVTRVALGIAEGGTLSGIAYILSRYYRRSEFVFRIGMFLGVAPSLAGAFGGLLAFGLLQGGPIGAASSWRKIFLVEGIITLGVGILCFFFLPDDPANSKFLTEDEKVLAKNRIIADRVGNVRSAAKEKTTWALVKMSFNFNSCLCAFGYMLANISFQGLALFLPTIIASLGKFTTVESNLRTVPVYLVGCAVAIIYVYVSLKSGIRGPILAAAVPLSLTGYAIFVATNNSTARYVACFFSVSGLTPAAALLLAWGTDNSAPETVRAVTTAFIPGFGTLGSVIATWTYLPTDAPNYHKGNSINLAAMCLFFVVTIIGTVYCKWENNQRDEGKRDNRLIGLTEEEAQNLGWQHPQFRYHV